MSGTGTEHRETGRARPDGGVGSTRYDAFISYSHRDDFNLAPAMRDGLQKLAKPWNRRRALSVFLDQSSLEVSHELGDSLEKRIDDTRWLVLLMSEASARSEWVGAEIAAWSREVGKERMALVLTSGTVVWDPVARDFDYEASTAVSPQMRGVYTGQESEPLYLDMSWTKEHGDAEKLLDLDQPRFRDAIATIAAPIHGMSKDELEGEDIRQHRRFVRARRIAILALTIVTIAAIVGFIVALIQRSNAIEQSERAASRAIAGDALNSVASETDLSALLALESVRVKNTTDARGGLVSVLSQPSRFLQRTDVHDAPVTAIAFAESGRVAATADESGVIRVWDVASDPAVVPQAAVRDEVISVGIEVADVFVLDDEDGTFLFAFDAGGGITFVDLARPDDLDQLPPPEELVVGAVSEDGSYVAGLAEDGSIVIYEYLDDATDIEFVPVAVQPDVVDFEAQGEEPFDLVLSDDGAVLAWNNGNRFAVWHWQTAEPEWREVETPVTSIGIGPGASVVAVGEVSGNLRLYDGFDLDIESPTEPMPVNEVFDLAFKPETDDDSTLTLASAHGNGDVVLWTVFDDPDAPPFGLWEDVLVGHRDEARKVGFSPDGRIASSDFEGEVIWWNDVPVSFLGIPWSPDAGSGDVVDAAFTPDGQAIAIDAAGDAWLIDPSTGEIADLSAISPARAVDSAADTVAVAGSGGQVAILTATGQVEATIDAVDSGDVIEVVLSSDGDRLVVGSDDDGIGVWDLSTMSEVGSLTLPDGFEPVSALVDDVGVWVGGRDVDGLPAALLFDETTGQPISDPLVHSDRNGNAVTAMALSSDGRVLATGSSDRGIQLWDAVSLEPIGEPLAGHRGNVSGIVFWDDDETLISTDSAGAVIVWDVSGREEVARLGGPTDGLFSLDLDPEGRLLLASSEDDAAWTWTLDQSEWRERACELANRNMTDVEWQRFGDGGTKVRHCPDFPIDGEFRDARYDDRLTD